MYANLYVSYRSKQGDLVNFFAHMNHKFPPSLSEYGKIRKASSKSDFIDYLSKVDGTVYLIDGPAFFHSRSPMASNAFGEYCKSELAMKIKVLASQVERIDIVFDIYRVVTIKRPRSVPRISIWRETQIMKSVRGSKTKSKMTRAKFRSSQCSLIS